MADPEDIAVEFDKAWARDMRRPAGADGAAIITTLAKQFGCTEEQVKDAVRADMNKIAGTG